MYEYRKIIHYGDTLELYEYEKPPRGGRGKKKRARNSDDMPHISDVGNTVQQQVEQKKVRLPENARRAILGFKRLVGANMGGTDNAVFATFTYAENMQDLKGARKDFNAFAQSLRVEFGDAIRYVVVAEFQERGAVHFHAILWGLPIEAIANERSTRLVATLWGKGFVDIRLVKSPQGIAVYLSKYLMKTFLDYRLAGMKAYIASRNIIKPVIDTNAMLLPYLYGAGYKLSTARILHEKEFMTQWLGQGRLRIYKQVKNIPHENRN